jgi:hypothetical protein
MSKLTCANYKFELVWLAYPTYGHAGLEMTLVREIRRIGYDQIEIVLILSIHIQRVFVIVEREIFAVNVKSFVILQQLEIDAIDVLAKVGY